MGCEVEERDGLVRIRGEMTIYGAVEVGADLMRRAGDAAVPCRIDLSEVAEIDTTGLQILMMARRARHADAQPVEFLAPSPAVTEVLELLRLTGMVNP